MGGGLCCETDVVAVGGSVVFTQGYDKVKVLWCLCLAVKFANEDERVSRALCGSV